MALSFCAQTIIYVHLFHKAILFILNKTNVENKLIIHKSTTQFISNLIENFFLNFGV